MNHARKEREREGGVNFTEEELERYGRRYDELIAAGRDQNSRTKGRNAKNFQVHYSNNMSEKDLRICKNRQKMAGGFRTEEGRGMYCRIMSVIGTVKRRGLNIFQSIADIMNGTPVII